MGHSAGVCGQSDQRVSDDIQQVFPSDADEAWERLTDDPDVSGIETARIDEIGSWITVLWTPSFLIVCS